MVIDRAGFMSGLCHELGMSGKQFNAYANSVAHYRNKFVAHLDDERVMYPPRLRVMRKSVRYLYEHLLKDQDAKTCLTDAPTSAYQFYSTCFRLAHDQYRKAT